MVGYPQSRSKKTKPTALPSTTFISGELHVTTCLPKFVPRPGPTCQCAPRSCHFCLNYWWTRKLTWVLVVVIFSSSFTEKKTWRNLKLVTRWISNIYYNIIIWIWKDISSNVGLLQVGSNPTFVPPGSPRFFCSHLLEPLSTEPLPLFLGSFLKQSRAVHMFSQIDAMFALVQRFETLCVSKKTKKMPHVSYWMCFFLGCIPQFQTRPKDMYIPVTSHNMHAMVWLVQSLRKEKKNISLCCRYVACFATFYTYRQYE